ncbi:TIGR01458 family HAD-type hydrolase [Nitrogeniibacter mangrovi]|uniref:Haloacid dehalogenase-like hydrolase domain-containing protein 2 n=1 Tax=Nitrogeniibacter mangrovi TaxID=2016596 RepID=A0A6C1B728_9RHOO|nr:TIGR01458 family HAD-type hydrolase [Nitrogeniibacter mangrovi]QID19511.1 TIGR01458 family HAD-type hydrolase [Nitrogeniibacter mangrovi]
MSVPALEQRPAAVLIDLAGVLHVGDAAVPGAVDALARLRQAGLRLRFLTNTTRSPRARIARMLTGLGFEVRGDEIQTAAAAARQVVDARGLAPFYLVHPDLAAEMGPGAEHPDAVVMGDMGPHLTYAHLNRAFRLLMDGAAFIAMARNRYFQEEDGLSLDMGAFVTGLEFSSGVGAEIVGKPAAGFFQAALDAVGVPAGEAVLIGDDLHDDVGAAQDCGIAGILVRTGKYRPEDEHDEEVRPARVVDDFAAAVAHLLALAAEPRP